MPVAHASACKSKSCWLLWPNYKHCYKDVQRCTQYQLSLLETESNAILKWGTHFNHFQPICPIEMVILRIFQYTPTVSQTPGPRSLISWWIRPGGCLLVAYTRSLVRYIPDKPPKRSSTGALSPFHIQIRSPWGLNHRVPPKKIMQCCVSRCKKLHTP